MIVEWFLALVFIVILGATMLSVYKFIFYQPTATSATQMLAAYQNLFERLEGDFRFAVKADQGQDALTLTDSRQQTVTYSLTDGTLSRKTDSGNTEAMLTSLHSGGFNIASPSRQLVSIWLVPSDSFASPFFTSFALQGGKR